MKQQYLLGYVPFLRPLSSRKKQPDERGASSTLRQVLSEVLLPYLKVWNKGRNKVEIMFQMVVSTKPPRQEPMLSIPVRLCRVLDSFIILLGAITATKSL